MAENEKKSSKTTVVLLIIIIVLLVVGGTVGAVMFISSRNDEPDPVAATAETAPGGIIMYDNAAVAIDEESYAEQLKKVMEEAEEGQITVQYKTSAYSDDGVHFYGEIGNSMANKYDMYFNIYLDSTFEEQILLTGLFPPGSGIQEFDSEIKLDPGEYKAVLVLTQVADDHATIHAQSYVTLDLVVGEQSE